MPGHSHGYCFICADQKPEFNRNVVGLCGETGKPVCEAHAKYCKEEGHGVKPFPVDEV